MSNNLSLSTFAAFLFFYITSTNASSVCFNPNNRRGYCISIAECPVLKALGGKKSITNEEKRFLMESSCTAGVGQPPLICCTTDVNFNKGSTSQQLRADLLPGLVDCGDQPSGSKIYSGMETGLDEFPWMTLFNYGSDKTPEFYCAGSLINQRYVLTAAHCVKDKKLHSLRFGEYDTSQEIDCKDSDCADPVVDILPEEIIIHPNYNIASIHRHNDIALVRLERNIEYTPFISPVCLPSVLSLNRSDVGASLVASGWGRTLKEKNSSIKLKISLPIYDPEGCQKAYKRTKASLVDFQFCAGGKFIEDTCTGDSGGPLMLFKGKWAIEGIVSFSRGCGLENQPGVYTRVPEYEDWIRSHIKP